MQLTSWLVLLSSLLTIQYCCCKARGTAATEARDDDSKGEFRQIWAVEGEDVELPCNLTSTTEAKDPVSMVLWFKDDAGIPLYNLDARGRDLFQAVHWAMSGSLGNRTYFQVHNGENARLKIKEVTFEDQGVFRCRVDFANSPTRNFRINLTLIEQPTKPQIYDAQGREVTGIGGPFLEGYELLLICQVSGGKPKPRVTWWKGKELLDDIMDTTRVMTSSSKFTVNHLFIANVTRALWNTTLECRATSGVKDKSKTIKRAVPLEIYLKPASVKIVVAEDEIRAGRPMTARCESWGSYPAARVVWRLGGLVIRESTLTTTQKTNSSVSKVALVLDKEDDGKELTCRAENPRFPGGVMEKTKTLRVYYPPTATVSLAVGYNADTLREADDMKLICNYQSNPEPTSIEWFHNNQRLEHSAEGGILMASRTLTLKSLTLEQNGAYSCWVKNTIGEYQTHPLTVRMKYAPRCKSGFERQEMVAVLKETLIFRCDIEADPEDSVRFSWTRNSSLGNVFPVSSTALVHRKGLSSTLEYRLESERDFGTVACWASNSVGRQRTPCIFDVQRAELPQKPIDCTLRNESSAIEVNCIPGSSGGLPQHFLLEVMQSENPALLQFPQNDQGVSSHAETRSSAVSDSGSIAATALLYQEENQAEPSFTVRDLTPGLDYTIAVYAVNRQGRSFPVLMENVRVRSVDDVEGAGNGHNYNYYKGRIDGFIGELSRMVGEPNWLASPLVLIGLIVGMTLAIVGVGAAIRISICRKTPSPQIASSEDPDDFTTPTYVSAQRIEPRIRYSADNVTSERTSIFMEDIRQDEPDLLQTT